MTIAKLKAQDVLDEFCRIYTLLYNTEGLINYRKAVDKFDKSFPKKGYAELLKQVCQLREDIMGSDREAAAFALAVENLTADC